LEIRIVWEVIFMFVTKRQPMRAVNFKYLNFTNLYNKIFRFKHCVSAMLFLFSSIYLLQLVGSICKFFSCLSTWDNSCYLNILDCLKTWCKNILEKWRKFLFRFISSKCMQERVKTQPQATWPAIICPFRHFVPLPTFTSQKKCYGHIFSFSLVLRRHVYLLIFKGKITTIKYRRKK